MEKILWLAGAGALGTLARYGLGSLVQQLAGSRFPLGTLTVNLIGSFLFGLIWALAEYRLLISAETRIIVLSGFMGAFTTFSTLMFETSSYLQDSQWAMAALNLLAHNAIGIVCLLLGLAIGRWLS